MMKQTLFFLFIINQVLSIAQSFSVSGKIVDIKDNTPLIGVNILLTNTTDSTQIKGTSSDADGNFSFFRVANGEYILNISYISYTTVIKTILVNDSLNLEAISMKEESKLLKEVIIQEKQIRVQQLGDTSQFNADAFKVNKDATTEDLLQKMPGVISENGSVKVNGEEVKKILIDGKPYFGDDPRTAIQNLPADVIDKIQVFERMSDQSTFTGFDDGNSQKTINIITKNGMSNSKFGRFYAGYGGPENRYNIGLNYNSFKGDKRFSILAMSNNINQQNFNIQDLVGATTTGNNSGGQSSGGRGGPGGMGRNSPVNNFLVGQQNGIATTTALGLNYTNKLGKQKKVTLSGSYFFNGTKNENVSSSVRRYISNNDSGLVYNETKEVESKNFNNRLNLRIEYVIDSSNSLTFTPVFSSQNNITSSELNALNTRNSEAIESETQNGLRANYFGINFSNDVLYQHKFKKKGRTISINSTTAVNTKRNNSDLFSLNNFSTDSTILNDTIDQKSNSIIKSYTISGSVVYTEPIKKFGLLSFTYTPSITKSNSERLTNNFDVLSDSYSLKDTFLSNQFDNNYLTNKIGIAYRYNNKKLNWTIGLSGQHALLESEQLSPFLLNVRKNFLSLLPNTEINYRFSKTENLRFFYRTNNNPPSISQLQNVIDNSNSLILTTGNPDLKQNFSQTIGLRYSRANTDKATSLFIFSNVTNTVNYVANSTTILVNDTIINDFFASSGTQFIKPINLNGFWNIRTFINYGFPITKMKSNMNFNSGFVYNRIPTLVNSLRNNSNSFAFNAGFSLSSNISKKIDFTVSYTATYTVVKNTLQEQNNNNFFNHIASAKINYQFWKGFVFNTSVSNTLNDGGSSSFNTSFWLLNASLAYKFLKDESLEVKFSAVDILNQNRNITRSINEIFTEDVTSLALQRYFLGTITYTLKKIGDSKSDDKPKDFIGMPAVGPPPGQ